MKDSYDVVKIDMTEEELEALFSLIRFGSPTAAESEEKLTLLILPIPIPSSF